MSKGNVIDHRPVVGWWRNVATGGVALVWLHQGLWCKVLGRDPRHRDIIAAVPRLSPRQASVATVSIGAAESALGVLVAVRGDRRSTAALQTAVLAAFNAGGLVVGRSHIANPGRLVARNGAFIAVIWSMVDGRRSR